MTLDTSIDETVLGDGDGLDERLGEVLKGENLTSRLTHETSGFTVGAREANGSFSSQKASPPRFRTLLPSQGKNGGTPRCRLLLFTLLTGFLVVSASELGLLLSVEMSADSALLLLVVLGKFDVGGVSVEFNSDVIEFNYDNLVLLVDTGLLELLDSLHLLSIDGHTHLLGSLVHLKFDDGFARDDLHLLLFSILRDLLKENGKFGFLRRAILGEDGVASGQRSAVADVIERVDLAGLNGAHSLGLIDEVRSEGGKGTDGSHRLTTDVHKTKGYGKTVVTDGNLLGRSLEGQVGILTSRGLDGKKSTDDSLLVAGEVKRTSHGAVDIVLGDNLVLVEHGSLNETSVFLEGAYLALFSLNLHLELVLVVGSPTRLDVDGEFTVLLVEKLLKSLGHLGVEHLDGRFNLPVAGLFLKKRGGKSREIDLAVSQLVIADGSELELSLALLSSSNRFDLGEETVGVGLVRLVRLDVVLEGSLTLLLISIVLFVFLSLEVLLIVILEESLHRGSLHSRFLIENGLLLGLNVGASLLGPDAEERDGTSLELNNTARVLGKSESGLEVELLIPAHLSGHVNGDIDVGGMEKFHSKGNHGASHLNLGDVSGGKSGTGLDTNSKSIERLSISRFKLNLDGTIDLEDGGHLGREDKRRSDRSGDGTSSLVDERRENGVETVSLSEDGFDLSELDSSIANDGLDHLGNNLLIDGKKGVVHITESDVHEGMGILLLLLARDDRELGEDSRENVGGLEGRSLSSDEHLLESALLNLLEKFVEYLVDVVLLESNLCEVLVPLSGECSLEGGHDLLGKHRVIREEGSPVKGSSVLILLVVDSPMLVGGRDHLAGLSAESAKSVLAVVSHGLLTGNLRARVLLEGRVDERVNLGGLLLKLVDDLIDNVLLRDSLHNLMEGSNTDLGMLANTGMRMLIILRGRTERILRRASIAYFIYLNANDLLFLLVSDDLVKGIHGQIHSRVGNGLESKNLLVSGLGSLEFVIKNADESLLHFARALSLLGRFDGELVTMISTHSVHQSTDGKPTRLMFEGLTTRILAERSEGLDDLLRGNTDGSELLEKGGRLERRDLNEMNCKMFDFCENFKFFESTTHLLDLLDFFLGGETKNLDDSGHFMSGSQFDSLLLRFHLDNHGLDKTRDNFVLVLDLGIGRFLEERLVSGSKELLLLLFPFHGIEKSLLLLALRGGDSLVLLVHFDKSHVSRDESGEESLLLRDGSIRVDGSELDLLDHETGRSSGDTVVEDIVSLSNTTRALLEVDRLGDEEFRFLTTRRRFRKDGVGDFAFSLEGKLERMDKGNSGQFNNTVRMNAYLGSGEYVILLGLELVGETRLAGVSLGEVDLQEIRLPWNSHTQSFKVPYLEHVDVDSLDIHRPGEILTVEFDLGDHSILVAETNGQTKSIEVLLRKITVTFDFLEELERLDLLGLGDFLLEGSDADLLDSQMSDSLGFGEGKGDEGLGTGGRLLRAGHGEAIGDLLRIILTKMQYATLVCSDSVNIKESLAAKAAATRAATRRRRILMEW
uniref:Uncharacterized protein n=1 Tax=Pristionchus pacificus TaxID=54126 RepID=A0A8R1V0S8_PRIPA